MTWFPRTLAVGLVIAAGLSLISPRTPEDSRPIVARSPADAIALVPSGAPTVSAEDSPILFPKIGEFDRVDQGDNEDYGRMRGESEEFLSAPSGEGGGIIRGRVDSRARGVHISNPDPRGGRGGRQPGKAEGVYDAMGARGDDGSGGRYGGRLGGRRNLVERGGRSTYRSRPEAILAGLVWLARHQDPNGRWSCAKFDATRPGMECNGGGYSENDEGVTALAVLAFLHAGYSPQSRTELRDPFGGSWQAGAVVRKGLSWLTGQQRPDGGIGFDKDDWFVIRHAAATRALCEAAGLTGDDALRQSARRAADRLNELREPWSGWGDRGHSPEGDLVATAWAYRALAAAENAGLPFPKRSREGIANFLDSARVNQPFGALDAAYDSKATGKVVMPGKNEDWNGHYLGAAVSLLAYPRCKKESAEVDRLFAIALISDLPDFAGRKIDYHAWNFAAAALASRRFELPKYYAAFREAALQALLVSQRSARDGCVCGSWDVDVDRWGFVGGRVYTTAMNVLTLLDLPE